MKWYFIIAFILLFIICVVEGIVIWRRHSKFISKTLSKDGKKIWDSYINMICRLVGSTKAFAFDVGTILFVVGPLSETGWLIVFGAFVGGNIAEKSKLMNSKLINNEPYNGKAG